MVTDMVSILASVGGALGLCLGFSLWGGFNTGFNRAVFIIGTMSRHVLALHQQFKVNQTRRDPQGCCFYIHMTLTKSLEFFRFE